MISNTIAQPRGYHYTEEGKTYKPDNCKALKEAHSKNLIELEGLSRLKYPGKRIRDDALKGINSIGYWNATRNQDWGLDWHRNEGIEIAFLESGQNAFSLQNADYILLPDDLTITRPWQPHKLGNPHINVGKLHWIIIDVEVRQPHEEWKWPDWIILSSADLRELTIMLSHNEDPVWKANKEVRKCFIELGHAIKTDKEGTNESIIKILINHLLLQLLYFFRSGKIVLNESLTLGLRSIDLFIQEMDIRKEWTLEAMANHCGMGITNFTQYFKQLTNMTPMHYLVERRLEEAARLLTTDPQMPVKEIAYELEFATSQYLSKVFSKHFGVSPQEYRAQHSGYNLNP